MVGRSLSRGVVCSLALVCAAAVSGVVLTAAAAQQAEQKTINSGVFDAEQVKRGRSVFDKVCSECHPTDVFGPEYMEGWSGASVGFLYEELKATMPYDSPGSLADSEYVEVVAYLFAINGVKPGEGELSTDVSELDQIVIEGPFEWIGDR